MSPFGWVIAGCVLAGAFYFLYEYPLATISFAAIVAVTSPIMNRSSKRHLEALALCRNTAIGTYVSHFEAVWIFKRLDLTGKLSSGMFIVRSWSLLIQRLVRALVVELVDEAVELALLCSEAVCRCVRPAAERNVIPPKVA
jgi:hypothetical protein